MWFLAVHPYLVAPFFVGLFFVSGHTHTLEKPSLYRAPARVLRPAPP